MMTPVSSTIYAIGVPIDPVRSPLRDVELTEEDLSDFQEPYCTTTRKVLCGVFTTILGVTAFYIFQPLSF